MKKLIFFIAISCTCFSCASNKDMKSLKGKLTQEAEKNQKLAAENQKLRKTVSEQENAVNFMKSENTVLKEEIKKLRLDLENAQKRVDEKVQGSLQQKEAEWKDSKYKLVQTADKEDYLSREEKNVYHYLNLARMNPTLFAETYLERFIQENEYHDNPNTRSLFNELVNMQPLPIIKPNKKMWELAQCHAVESGKTGYMGRERVKKCDKGYAAEGLYFGTDAYSGLKIVLQMLIDADSKTLENRKACLGNYATMGVSIQLHKTNSYGAIVDFQ